MEHFHDLVEKLDQWMMKVYTEPIIWTIIKQGLQAWKQSRHYHFVMTHRPGLLHAIVIQEKLGWGIFLEGYMATTWQELQYQYGQKMVSGPYEEMVGGQQEWN